MGKPTQPLIPSTPKSTRPISCASRSSSRTPLNAKETTHLDRRCDEVLECLVRDGAEDWGRAQERQSRLCDENRDLSHHSSKVRLETQNMADALRAEGIEPQKR